MERNRRGMRILIVEDEMKIRTGMAKLITAHTDHVVIGEAKNGQEGLEFIYKFHPELVITDIRMPVMDGLEMLACMREAGIQSYCVVLSGYSEFEYAQEAIRYGVEAYLLKPLAPEDVIGMLDSVQNKIAQQQRQQEQTKEGLLRSILLGGKADYGKEIELLKKLGGFSEQIPYYLIGIYVGNTSVNYPERISQIMGKIFRAEKNGQCDWVMLEHIQQVFCLVQGEISRANLIYEISLRAYRMLKEEEEPVWAMEQMNALSDIADAKERIQILQTYGMRLGYRQVLTEEVVRTLEMQDYRYPQNTETAIKNAIFRGTGEQLQNFCRQFQQEVRRLHCEPKYVKRAYQKLLHSVSHILQETDSVVFKAVEDLDPERQIVEAVTLGEMEYTLNRVVQIIQELRDKKEDIRNFAILKAINYIKEHYSENISLDQLADYLEMTPEYLSTLFNREMGINFSTFLKQFRISHAKRLLKGSDKKIYEIAIEVGYNDPKYFNRVFKEVMGISPGDYRQQE